MTDTTFFMGAILYNTVIQFFLRGYRVTRCSRDMDYVHVMMICVTADQPAWCAARSELAVGPLTDHLSSFPSSCTG
jgi:hypothetical protein